MECGECLLQMFSRVETLARLLCNSRACHLHGFLHSNFLQKLVTTFPEPQALSLINFNAISDLGQPIASDPTIESPLTYTMLLFSIPSSKPMSQFLETNTLEKTSKSPL
ncbi:hypothetical protein COLO4_24744 [Corchorus olitorius]|uniref:Uncharacterized protein n=1 Tax=Corchorus olitorius TaxID=93759 RepID=A0A1R3I7B1_9ROSI|nr:hypothetical protein COLO4_24744 [Corchorus olitorius]